MKVSVLVFLLFGFFASVLTTTMERPEMPKGAHAKSKTDPGWWLKKEAFHGLSAAEKDRLKSFRECWGFDRETGKRDSGFGLNFYKLPVVGKVLLAVDDWKYRNEMRKMAQTSKLAQVRMPASDFDGYSSRFEKNPNLPEMVIRDEQSSDSIQSTLRKWVHKVA